MRETTLGRHNHWPGSVLAMTVSEELTLHCSPGQARTGQAQEFGSEEMESWEAEIPVLILSVNSAKVRSPHKVINNVLVKL